MKINKKKNQKKADNYLDYIPVHNENYKFQVDSDGKITIFVENKGLFNRIAQKFFKKPKISQIHLDEIGSFIWKHIDGKNTIYDIGHFVKEEFGKRAEPLYNLLVYYMKVLENYGFIVIFHNF